MIEFIIKCLNKDITPIRVISEYNNRRGLGKFKDWEMWEIPNGGLYKGQSSYFIDKENQIVSGYRLGECLEYIEQQSKTSS